MKKENIGKIILLLLLLYCSAVGNYLNSGEDYLYKNAKLLGLIDLVACTLVLIIVPFTWRMINGKRFNCEKGKSICKWNSIIILVISIILMISIKFGFVGGIGAIIYYFINKWLFVDENTLEVDEVSSNKKFKCSNCGAIFYDGDKYCNSCKKIFETEEDKKYKCDNCGFLVEESDEKCPNCKLPFDGDINLKTEIIKKEKVEKMKADVSEQEQKEKQYKCDNCGTLVKETDKKCPKCGEKFEEDDESFNLKSRMDQKYSDLTKLKKLFDKKIITKEEFEKEKKKILEDD